MRKLSLLVIILLCSCHSNKENQYFEFQYKYDNEKRLTALEKYFKDNNLSEELELNEKRF